MSAAGALRIFIAGGTGGVGTTLAGRLARAGNAVVLGSREPTSARALESVAAATAVAGAGARGSVSSCESRAGAAGADVVLLAFPSAQVLAPESLDALVASLGDQSALAGKPVLDACNALVFGPGGVSRRWEDSSLAEQWQARLPGALVVKAFNTCGREVMADPSRGFDSPATLMFACDPAARELAARVAADVGFAPEYVGPLRFARTLEALAVLWVHMGRVAKLRGASFVFQVVEQREGAALETARGLKAAEAAAAGKPAGAE